jgi:outer membrane translocation and assembly module TamA
MSAAFRVHPNAELFAAWRGERHLPLETSSDFSLWNDDDTFRPNLIARDGRLNAILVGASVDSRGYDRESIENTYRRHQFETPFGDRLVDRSGKRDPVSMWRIDWTSEISSPDAFASDFNFRRHIVSGRGRLFATEHQEIAARVIGGWADGDLPPQRRFAVGGIGSVHGYTFKESTGDTFRLFNLEYGVGWHNGPQLIGFLDAGRTTERRSAAASPRAGAPWLKGAGWGVALGDVRVDFGYKLGASEPSSVQVLLRLGRTF